MTSHLVRTIIFILLSNAALSTENMECYKSGEIGKNTEQICSEMYSVLKAMERRLSELGLKQDKETLYSQRMFTAINNAIAAIPQKMKSESLRQIEQNASKVFGQTVRLRQNNPESDLRDEAVDTVANEISSLNFDKAKKSIVEYQQKIDEVLKISKQSAKDIKEIKTEIGRQSQGYDSMYQMQRDEYFKDMNELKKIDAQARCPKIYDQAQTQFTYAENFYKAENYEQASKIIALTKTMLYRAAGLIKGYDDYQKRITIQYLSFLSSNEHMINDLSSKYSDQEARLKQQQAINKIFAQGMRKNSEQRMTQISLLEGKLASGSAISPEERKKIAAELENAAIFHQDTEKQIEKLLIAHKDEDEREQSKLNVLKLLISQLDDARTRAKKLIAQSSSNVNEAYYILMEAENDAVRIGNHQKPKSAEQKKLERYQYPFGDCI